MILVFGGNGQLGRELVRSAHERSIALTAVPREVADIADREAVEIALAKFNATIVVNAAAYTKVDQAEVDIGVAERENVTGPAILAAACEAFDAPLIHISTDFVFDGNKNGPYVEGDPVGPLGVYGRTKAAGEEAVRRHASQHVILRTAWVYGEFGHNFLKTIIRLGNERDELRIVADQYGCPTSTRELANAVLRLSGRFAERSVDVGTYHFAGSGVASWYGFAARIVAGQAARGGRVPKVIPIATSEYPTKAVRPKNSTFDCTLFHRAFGFRARDWREEVDMITQAVLDNLYIGGPEHAT